jgi:hypothetical protein
MKNVKLWQLIGCTFVLWYLVIGFVMWEWDWIKHLSTASNMGRFWFFLGLTGKIVLDFILFRYFKEEPKNKQKELSKDAEGYIDKSGLN